MEIEQKEEKKAEKNLERMAQAIERTYGNTWFVMRRNFLAGLANALGSTVGYMIVIAVIVFIAIQLGVFTKLQQTWQNATNQITEFQKIFIPAPPPPNS